MDETILFPSPNWFQVAGLVVTKDGWIIYGGPTRGFCILEPLARDAVGVLQEEKKYQAHVVSRAHTEKIVCIDVSPEWPSKKCIITGGLDGVVKHWQVEKESTINVVSTLSQGHHAKSKEEIIGAGYTTETHVVSVGSFGDIAKWDLNSNVVKSYTQILRNLKPLCMSCSPHLPFHIAVGTKQGVVLVIDIQGANSKVLYKIRSQDEEILNVTWCPQYQVTVNKTLHEACNQKTVNDRIKKIRASTENQKDLDESGISKKLPDDSFESSSVIERSDDKNYAQESLEDISITEDASAIEADDDVFDIYKDHDADEFGHKKYQPEDILVPIEKDTKEIDYLTECSKLKEDILNQKNESNSVSSLVEAMDNVHLEALNNRTDQGGRKDKNCDDINTLEASDHIHKHMLATVGKYGALRIWSKTGKLVASTCVPHQKKNPKGKGSAPLWTTALWYRPDVLLVADGKSQLLECNPLIIDCRHRVEWKPLHAYHKRGLFCIATNAPRVQTPTADRAGWLVWTVAQDKTIVCYSHEERRAVATHNTCGGFIYSVQACPYDARKVALSVGDGTVRVWEADTTLQDEAKLVTENVATYWQTVQGKVLTVVWHPTRENLLAFSTAESRVGVIETGARAERAARALAPAPRGGVYSLCWGEGAALYATAGGHLVRYDADNVDGPYVPILVTVDQQPLDVAVAVWEPAGMLVGGCAGQVVLLSPCEPHDVLAAIFVYTKMIHTLVWHPQQISSSNEESPCKNLIATCSLEKNGDIVILQLEESGGVKKLNKWKTLSGHRLPVYKVSWNPHRDGLLLSASQDSTVRVWDVSEGTCLSIFGKHTVSALCAAWSPRPQLQTHVLSGGGDCCLRLWDFEQHPAHAYEQVEIPKRKKSNKKRKNLEDKEHKVEKSKSDCENQLATTVSNVVKPSKKFLLPILQRQVLNCKVEAARILFEKYQAQTGEESAPGCDEEGEIYDVDFIKIFGTASELAEFLDMEKEQHELNESAEQWIMLAVFRGHMDEVVRYASRKDMLCPFLLSLAPCVSYKYWKDTTRLYLTQIDRLTARGEENKLLEARAYGGALHRKVAALLSVHDVKGAVAALMEGRLFKEAYVLCKIRYMEGMLEEALNAWVEDAALSGKWVLAALLNIVRGNLIAAANYLAKVNEKKSLELALDIAKSLGQVFLLDNILLRMEEILQNQEDGSEDALQELPSRLELVIKDKCTVNAGEFNGSGDDNENGIADFNETVPAERDAAVDTDNTIALHGNH